MFLFPLLIIAPCILAKSHRTDDDSPNTYHNFTSAYSFDANLSYQPAWMGKIPDSINITSLSIPGTHDTMTFDIDKINLQCQNWNLTVQMQAGIRYVDIRATEKFNNLYIYHGTEYTGYTLKRVLMEMFNFLDENPSEMLIMRFKEEGPPIGGNSITFENAFNYIRLVDPDTKDGVEKHLVLYRNATLPTLGEMRSKILVLQDFTTADNLTYSIRWGGPQMVVEDLFNIRNETDLDTKWVAIRKSLVGANFAPLANDQLYLTHTSAAIGVLPIEAAAATSNGVPIGMNDRTGSWLESSIAVLFVRRTGIVISDFPGKKLIDNILARNQFF